MSTVRAEPYEFEFQPSSVALLIIDMQRDFVDPGGFGEALGNDVSLLRKAVPPTIRVLNAARQAGVLVIHTREGHRPDLADLPPAKKARGRLAAGIGDPGPMGRILVRGEHGHDIIAELEPARRRAGGRQAGQGRVLRHRPRRHAARAAASRSSSSAASPPKSASTRRCARPTTAATTAWCSRTASAPISRNSRRSALRHDQGAGRHLRLGRRLGRAAACA